jgi:hypothetical protein
MFKAPSEVYSISCGRVQTYLAGNGFWNRNHFDISVNELPWMREEVMTTKNTILKIRSA